MGSYCFCASHPITAYSYIQVQYSYSKAIKLICHIFHTCTTSALKIKRYVFIFTDDQTRVVLSTIDGIPGSHYINANYIYVSTVTYYLHLKQHVQEQMEL
jgi:hypothetical protein